MLVLYLCKSLHVLFNSQKSGKKKKQQPLLEPSILSFASVKCAVPIETSTGNDLT